ncbi:rRNA-processing protein las1 [Neophaeococcomyces mojaviensis]|uniref:rRNA-processing protein las1 n=1 Tax=Neophaeococcomyces mojaviensis TaxID=3383035 RepID=A0ACC3A0U9_9EURO|nr:rRNA-processing protein las1 [Knufia sp. JES_112]
MSEAIFFPWRDESELAMVRDWFFPDRTKKDPYTSNNIEDMRPEAVARVNVWTFKSHRVPPAILSTADLTDSILKYEQMAQTADPNSYRAVQFMFAFAFMRFVNSFVDRDVARAATASLATSEDDAEEERNTKVVGESSMYAHAAAISMPSRFVDLRHQVSHGELPEVRTLKNAAEDALAWLWERWWKGNAIGDAALALRRFEARKQQRTHLEEGEQEGAVRMATVLQN